MIGKAGLSKFRIRNARRWGPSQIFVVVMEWEADARLDAGLPVLGFLLHCAMPQEARAVLPKFGIEPSGW
ncbi:MAG: hypothetical protein NTNFB02_34300 [Nitrospira sp.]